jgi:cellulose synthase/poly-beta-1,6-N-acetylglucosamine synthase-like glycosyltransferase
MGNEPVVAIGCPIQNREEIVKEYLEGISNLDYPKNKLIPCFFVNNTSDKTGELILNWMAENKKDYKLIVYERDDKVYKRRTDRQDRENRDYTLFTIVRNRFLKLVKTVEWDYLFSVDSDIIIQPDTLKKLLAHKKEIVSALVYNGFHFGQDWYNYRVKKERNGRRGYYVYRYIPQNIFEVDVTGACYLIRRGVIDRGIKYKVHKFGEDVGFCEEAKSKGIKIYCDPTIKPEHKLQGDKRWKIGS